MGAFGGRSEDTRSASRDKLAHECLSADVPKEREREREREREKDKEKKKERKKKRGTDQSTGTPS